jgi:hypothetical protein
MYRCTDKCCYSEDGGSWFNKKKGTIHVLLRIEKKTVRQMQGGGNGGE